MYLDMNLFITAPVIEMQGRMEHMARASRQFLANAKTKPVKNAEMKLTVRATFSDTPCCTKSGGVGFFRCQYFDIWSVMRELRTGVGLNAGGNFTGANLIEEGNVLAKDSPEIALANTLSGHLGRVDPDTHIDIGADEHAYACREE